ncbi:MAG: hypothetical protein ACOC4I_01620 [Spirochaetota bacterium]
MEPSHSDDTTPFFRAVIRSAFLLVLVAVLLFLFSVILTPRVILAANEPVATEGIESIPDFVAPAPSDTFDTVILNGRVMDPESGFDRQANLGIVGDTIVAITLDDIEGSREIDADGLVVAPGFIDVTMPGYPDPALYQNIQYWKLSDGVTTALWTHDGWHDPERVIAPLRGERHLINWGVGTSVNRLYAPDRSHQERLTLLENAVQRGGISVGASPEYFTGISTEALIDYARIADSAGLWLGLHLRYSRMNTELDGVREAITVAEESGAHVHIFHINSTGATYNAMDALRMLEEARERGVAITADVYPYSYWMTYLNSARFNDGWREGFDLDYEDLFYVPIRDYLTEAEFRARRSENGLTVVPEDTISWEDAILPALERDWIFIASDGWTGRNPFRSEVPFAGHPRGSGTFSTAVSLHRRYGIPLMTVIRKVTLDPAQHMQNADNSFLRRGRIQRGAYADITVFDADTVGGSGTVLDSARQSAGIRFVLVNGVLSYEDGEVLSQDAGMLLNRGL